MDGDVHLGRPTLVRAGAQPVTGPLFEPADGRLGAGTSGLPPSGNSFFQMKSRDSFAPIGPWLVIADEIPNPQALPVRLAVNGTVKQDFNTSDMAHDIPRCIEWVSHIHTLEPGDILATGTNHRGLSAFMDGDTVELEVAGLGRLRVGVQEGLKRSWSRETRLDRQAQGFDTPTPQTGGRTAPGG
jgi:hypothetical protein